MPRKNENVEAKTTSVKQQKYIFLLYWDKKDLLEITYNNGIGTNDTKSELRRMSLWHQTNYIEYFMEIGIVSQNTRPGTNRVKYERLNNYPDIKIQIIITTSVFSIFNSHFKSWSHFVTYLGRYITDWQSWVTFYQHLWENLSLLKSCERRFKE